MPWLANHKWVGFMFARQEQYPIIPFADSKMYLSKLQNFLDGELNYSTGILKRTETDQNLGGLGQLFRIWGELGRLLNLNIFTLYLIMIFISSILTYLAIYSLLSNLNLTYKKNVLLTTLISFTILGVSLGRPSPNQLTLWSAILFISGILRLKKSYKFDFFILFISFLYTYLTNPFYFILIVFLFLMIATNQRKYLKFRFKAISSLICLFSIGNYLLSKSNGNLIQSETYSRWGVIYDRLPGALNLSISLFLISLLFFVKYRSKKRDSDFALFALSFSNLLALNSQVFTGIVFEQESHYDSITKILISFSVVSALISIGRVKIAKITWVTALILTITQVIQTINIAQAKTNDLNWTPWTKKEIKLLNELNQSQYDGAVLLMSSFNNPDLMDSISLYTKVHLYWSGNIWSDYLSDNEILERFACTIKPNYSYQEFLKDYSMIFAHKYLSEYLRYPKWNNISKKFGFEVYRLDVIDKRKQKEYTYLMNINQNECLNKFYRYHLDLKLNENFRISKINK